MDDEWRSRLRKKLAIFEAIRSIDPTCVSAAKVAKQFRNWPRIVPAKVRRYRGFRQCEKSLSFIAEPVATIIAKRLITPSYYMFLILVFFLIIAF